MFARLFSVFFWVLLIYSATVIVPNATVPPLGFLCLYWHILSEAHTVTVQYIQSQYSTNSHNTVHTVKIQYIYSVQYTQYIQSQSSTYSANTVHTVSIQYIESQYSTYSDNTVHTVTVQYIESQYSTYRHIQLEDKPRR